MFIICDATEVVRDKASNEANLSRGYNYSGYTVHEVPQSLDVRVGDSYDGDNLVINKELRIDKAIKSTKMAMVEASIRVDKATSLGFSDIESHYNAEYNGLATEKVRLETEKLSLS